MTENQSHDSTAWDTVNSDETGLSARRGEEKEKEEEEEMEEELEEKVR